MAKNSRVSREIAHENWCNSVTQRLGSLQGNAWMSSLYEEFVDARTVRYFLVWNSTLVHAGSSTMQVAFAGEAVYKIW